MPGNKRMLWWLNPEDDGVFVYLTEGPSEDGKRLEHIQADKSGQHRKYTSVVKVAPGDYGKRKEDVKIIFKSREEKRAVRKSDFVWSKEGPFRGVKGSQLSTTEFCNQLNRIISDELGQTSTIVSGETSNDEPNAGEGCEAGPSGESSSSGAAKSSRKRKSADPQPSDIPLLHKKFSKGSDTHPENAEETIKEKVQGSFLGTAKINIDHLELGPLLRQINVPFVDDLKKKMLEFPTHWYQPLCILTKDVPSKDDFQESVANGYNYEVIGGCHSYVAAKQIHDQHPEMTVFSSRICVIYHQSIGREAVMWLANKHNEVGSHRHRLTLKEKIQMCRNFKEHYEGDREKWKQTCTTILNEAPRTIGLYCTMASWPDREYNLLEEVHTMNEDGRLKGQVLGKKDIASPPDISTYVFRDVVLLPMDAVKKLLTMVVKREISLSDMRSEAQTLSKLQKVQQKFLELMDIQTWDRAVEEFPNETKREVLVQFVKYPLKTTPEELRLFCRRIRQQKEKDHAAKHTGRHGCQGAFMEINVAEMTTDAIKSVLPNFAGFDLAILDMPNEMALDDVKSFIRNLVASNGDVDLQQFNLCVLTSIERQEQVASTLSTFKDFKRVIKAFYHVEDPEPDNQDTQSGLMQSLFGLVIAKTTDKEFTWANGRKVDLLITKMGNTFCDEDGLANDFHQKPLSLYREIIDSLSHPAQWVLDACCGTGTGIIAALEGGRHCLAMDNSPQAIWMANIRLTKDMVGETCDEDEEQESETGSETSSD